jgi:hypothetical protein
MGLSLGLGRGPAFLDRGGDKLVSAGSDEAVRPILQLSFDTLKQGGDLFFLYRSKRVTWRKKCSIASKIFRASQRGAALSSKAISLNLFQAPDGVLHNFRISDF